LGIKILAKIMELYLRVKIVEISMIINMKIRRKMKKKVMRKKMKKKMKKKTTRKKKKKSMIYLMMIVEIKALKIKIMKII